MLLLALFIHFLCASRQTAKKQNELVGRFFFFKFYLQTKGDIIKMNREVSRESNLQENMINKNNRRHDCFVWGIFQISYISFMFAFCMDFFNYIKKQYFQQQQQQST
jgi:hypothetical protein